MIGTNKTGTECQQISLGQFAWSQDWQLLGGTTFLRCNTKTPRVASEQITVLDDNCVTRTRKALIVPFSLKWNSSANSSLVVTINAWTSYLVAILAFCIPAWNPNITVLTKLEKFRKIALRCIFNSNSGDDCQSKFRRPFFEIYELLLFLKLFDADYDTSTVNVIEISKTKTTRET